MRLAEMDGETNIMGEKEVWALKEAHLNTKRKVLIWRMQMKG